MTYLYITYLYITYLCITYLYITYLYITYLYTTYITYLYITYLTLANRSADFRSSNMNYNFPGSHGYVIVKYFGASLFSLSIVTISRLHIQKQQLSGEFG